MDEFERVARAAVDEASPRLRAAWRSAKRVEFKGTIDLVTETDREIEELITTRLRHAFPDHAVVGEEASSGAEMARPDPDQYCWYLDPLDGTTNFAHSFPQFATSLALARGTDLLLGIVHDPIRHETFAARAGHGATLNGEPIRVSDAADLGLSLLGTGFPYDARVHTDYYVGFFADFLRRVQGIRRGGSAALDLCYVACGRLDGFWEWRLKPWDTAAGVLLVREAGGTVTDFRGGAFDLYGQQTLATNGHLHGAMSELLAQRLAENAPPQF